MLSTTTQFLALLITAAVFGALQVSLTLGMKLNAASAAAIAGSVTVAALGLAAAVSKDMFFLHSAGTVAGTVALSIAFIAFIAFATRNRATATRSTRPLRPAAALSGANPATRAITSGH